MDIQEVVAQYVDSQKAPGEGKFNGRFEMLMGRLYYIMSGAGHYSRKPATEAMKAAWGYRDV